MCLNCELRRMVNLLDFSRIQQQRKHVARDVVHMEECLAKTRTVWRDGERITEKGCDVLTHLWITCRILQLLRKIWNGYPRGDAVGAAAFWLAAVHDIGKVTPAFLSKIYAALDLPLPWPPVEEAPGGHARSSEVALEARFGSNFARLAGCHHGGASWRLGPQDSVENAVLGGEAWEKLRFEILARLQRMLKLPDCDLRHLPDREKDLTLGAVILADWLSSGMDLPWQSPLPTDEQMIEVIHGAGLVPMEWMRGRRFEELFGFSMNPLQRACAGLARPGCVIVIESGMGSGKTEAALSLAYQLLAEKQANGVYFAMPTKLTSERIFDRLNDFLKHAASCDVPDALLIHGDSWLDWPLAESDDSGLYSRRGGSWFQTKKRALLAPFAAGTVDQALLSVVNVRHRALRAFALAGKVVIIDEVHSYDSYTGSLVVSLVRHIREWGGTAVILSATLTAAARARLLGCGRNISDADAYPLISVAEPGTEEVRKIAIPAGEAVSVEVRRTSEVAAALDEALEHAGRGEQVLWIENTVLGAQEIFRQLGAATGGGLEIGLIHSRFPACRRQSEEARWVRLLGKNGGDERRRRGRILVATQVLEQSVDVDADFLITRLAPGDMLFQRMGRLWRHPSLDGMRPEGARRAALILIPPECETPDDEKKFRNACLPYAPYWVLRTLRVWREFDAVTLPADIRPLLERIYADVDEEGVALVLKKRMLDDRDKLEHLADISQGSADAPLDDDFVDTRVNDRPEVQLLLIHKGNRGLPLRERVAALFADVPIELPAPSAPARERIAATRALLRCMLKVPEHIAPRYDEFPTEAILGNLLWTGEMESRPVRAAYVDASGRLLAQSGAPTERECFYHEKLGFCVVEKQGGK